MDSKKLYQVSPTACVYGGDALARLPDGRAVFIPYALPGDLLKIRLVEEKERYARGEIVEVIEASGQRIEPRCPHFSECGGCHYQNLSYHDQLKIKESIFISQLERVGKFKDPPVKPIVASPAAWNYRNQIQFHITDEGEPGFKKHRSDQTVPVKECHLPVDNLNRVWPEFNLEFIPGLDRISLRSGEEGDDVLIVFESSDPQPIEFSVDLQLSAVHQGPGGEIILAGDDFTIVKVRDFPFVVSAGSFFQANISVAELIIEHLLEKLPLDDQPLILDMYCGVGLFSVFLAPYASKLIGIESDPQAGEDFLYNLSNFENVELFDLPAEEVLQHLEENPQIILVDPPRAGLSRTVLDHVVALNPDMIVYISCDPATLARDGGRFRKQGYELSESTPFDMFPQTYHIESLNIFQRAVAE